ncbi:hypothetical protein [Alienimonas californiensis]|uniref:Uncharacterized protein n=1 Tax=Alienimonas californiensis TaxID=2527989 RepID=A0A517P5D0_9PLAN|nr:hypothetical protein [Alienimonas californiensis]QDT14574.1 hypothetical protein CA12_06490 [Alienimonas californiensis]
MSYDLFLKPSDASSDGEPPRVETLRSYLAARGPYLFGKAAGVGSPTGVRYGHGDTGVTFTLDLAPAGEGGTNPEDPTVAAFAIDLLVPRFFARTAAAELAALCARFDLIAEDPQTGDAGPFDPTAFLDGWERVAEMAARQVAGRGQAPPALPAAALDAAHDWNAHRAEWRDRMPPDGPGIPRMQLRLARAAALPNPRKGDPGEPATARTWCAWVDAAPIVLPPCDDVLLVRDKLRPRRFGLFKAAEASLCLMPRSSVVGLRGAESAGPKGAPGFGPAPERFPPGSRQLLDATKEAVAWFRAPPADAAPPHAVPPRAVIESERVAAALARS